MTTVAGAWTDTAASGTHLDALCLHGVGGSARQWYPVFDELPGDVRGIAVDLPGHGSCPLPLDTPADEVAAYLFRALRAVGGQEPFILVGHSLGGVLALHLALIRPAAVARLVLLASAARVRLHPGLLAQLARGHPSEQAVTAGLGARVEPGLVSWVAEDFRRAASRWSSDDVWGIARADYTGQLSAVVAPTLVAVPTGDAVISPRRGRDLAAKIPGARLVLAVQTGHYLHLELPALVASLMSQGIADGDSPRPAADGAGERA